MEYLVGIFIAAGVVAIGHFVGFGRERSFYSTVLIFVGSYYVLFAAMAENHHAIHVEILGALVFLIIAIIGFQRDMRFVAAGLIGHGIFDVFVHQRMINNPGVPIWWPGFCAACDVALGVWLFFTLKRSQLR